MSSATKIESRESAPALVADSLALGVMFAIALTVIQRGLGFLRGVLFCRLMTDEELGQFSMLSGALMMLAPLAVLGLPGSFGRFVEHYSHTGQLRDYLRMVAQVCVATTTALAMALIIWPGFFAEVILGEPESARLIRVGSICLVLLTWCNYLTTLVESLRQVRLASLVRFVSGVSFTVLGVGLLVIWQDKSQAALWAFGLSSLLGAIPAWWFLRCLRVDPPANHRPLSGSDLWPRLIPFAAWWWLSNLLHNCYELSDRYLLVAFGKMSVAEIHAAVGQIHSSRVLPTLMVGVASMLSGLLMPFVTAAWVRGEHAMARAQLNWTVKLTALGMAVINLGIVLTAPILFQNVLEGRYQDGLAILPFGIVYCSWLSLLTVSQDYLWVIERGRLAVGVMFGGLLTTIISAAFLVPGLGIWGSIWATLAGNLVALLGIYSLNLLTGCKPDLGVWMTVLTPLLFLLGTASAVAAVIFLGWAICRSDLYFSSAEKAQIRSLIERRWPWLLGGE